MFQLYEVPSSKITDKTINLIHKFIIGAKTDPEFVSLSRDVVKECSPRDSICELTTVYNKLKSIIKYSYDPYQVEYVQSPWETLNRKTGDCDCMVTLISAMMGALGYNYRLVTIKADKLRPDEWSHIFAEIMIPNKGWQAVDLTVPEAVVGWSPLSQGDYPNKIWDEPIY